VATIRLTDDGEFADRCDLTRAIYEIRNPKAAELAVWYVHGWKHNADPGDSDFKEFSKLVAELNKRFREVSEEERRHVVGIYVGWDGAVGPTVLQNLTFWNRKRAADRISQSAVLSKIIAATKYARRQVDEQLTSRDLTIMIGHSFGARILYTATSQVLIDEVQRQHPGYKEASYGVMIGPADLILLLNPAFEASIFTAMHSVRRTGSKRYEIIDDRQQPLLLAISTENDWATGKAFPVGQSLEFATRRDRRRQTLGNHKPYLTHRLARVISGNYPATADRFWYDHFEDAGLQLVRTTDRQPGNPFLVARTTSDVVDGHNGIWEEALRKWMVAFVLKLERERAHHPRQTRMAG
jgi:hypothetical protein